jgi:hypothetical protein
MISLLTFLLGLVTGPLLMSTLNRFYAIRSNQPSSARKLINSIKGILGYLRPPEGHQVSSAQTEVPPELFDDFLANVWPWQQPGLNRSWARYCLATSSEDKAVALENLLLLVDKYSGASN